MPKSYLIVLLLAFPASARAADYALTIGGGPDPYQSQVSLEENVKYFREVLKQIGWGDAHHTVLFGSGSEELPDVCFTAPARTDDAKLRVELGKLFGQNQGLELEFRHNRLEPDGPATRQAIFQQIQQLANTLVEGDRFLLYLTGHGLQGNPQNNGLFYTWNRERISVRELAAALDHFDPQVQVLVVMVQCYGGSFANLMFLGGDQKNGLAPHRRAGFFATVATRPAAGCNPDLSEGIEEYSTYFWSALSGIGRDGSACARTDFNDDGFVSPNEAHAHAMLNAPTIDISTKTSDEFLRLHAPHDPRNSRFFRFDRDFSRLSAVATECEQQILNQLSSQLSLGGESRIAEAQRQLEQVEYEHLAIQEELSKLRSQAGSFRETLTAAILKRWPSLKSPWHPLNEQIFETNATALRETLAVHPDYPLWHQCQKQIEKQESQDRENQRKYAKLQRLIHTAQTVALAQNLRITDNSQLVERFEQMRQLEAEFLRVELR